MLLVCARKQICCILCPVDQERDFSLFCGAFFGTTPLATKSCCLSIRITCYLRFMYNVCFISITQICSFFCSHNVSNWGYLVSIHNHSSLFLFLLNNKYTTPDPIQNLPNSEIDGETIFSVSFTSFTDLLSLIFYLGIIHLVHQRVMIEIIDSARGRF